MSADNWSRCPRCLRQSGERLAAAEARVDAMYGKVPVEEFDEERANVARMRLEMETGETRTFREDYEIYGADEGIIHVSYRGSCKVCSLTMKFEDERPIPGVDGPVSA